MTKKVKAHERRYKAIGVEQETEGYRLSWETPSGRVENVKLPLCATERDAEMRLELTVRHMNTTLEKDVGRYRRAATMSFQGRGFRVTR